MHPATRLPPIAIEVTLRIPGSWAGPEDFLSRLPPDCRTTESELILADGSVFELNVLPADEDFPRVFADSCPKLPTPNEREQIENYQVNICVTGPGGSLSAAKSLMAAGAAILDAGGAGVFIDNCGISHGATDWRTLLESADDGGVYWAFVSTVGSEIELYSVGMHVLGLRDAIVPRTGADEFDYRTMHSFLGYTAFSGVKLTDGEAIGDPVLANFRVFHQADDRTPAEAPTFNPFGRWRLEPIDVSNN